MRSIKWMTCAASLLVAGSLYAGAQTATEPEEQPSRLRPQTTCPIMGGSINKEQYVDHEGKRIYVCCPPCKQTVKADPEAALKKLAASGEGPSQATCPIMKGVPITAKSRYVDHEGQRIYVCCGGCARRVQADPEAALETLEKQGVVPARVPEKS